MHLVLRLHDPTGGQVLVDRQDLKTVALQSYLEQVPGSSATSGSPATPSAP